MAVAVAVLILLGSIGAVGLASVAATSHPGSAPAGSASGSPPAPDNSTASAAAAPPLTSSVAPIAGGGSAAASGALAASKIAGVSPRDVFVPRPSATPAQIASSLSDGYIAPLYTSTPAPIGLAEYGLAQNRTTGAVDPFILNTTSVQASFDPAATGGPNATDLADSSPDLYGVQLNAVVTDVTLFGGGPYQFWTQCVAEYEPYGGLMELITNVWNFSSPAGYLSSNAFYAHGPLGTQVDNSYYYATDGAFSVSYPFNLTLTMVSGLLAGRDVVYFSVNVTSPSGDISEPDFDYVVFNSIAPGGPPLTQPANYTADGFQYNPFGLTNDFELTIGGPGAGSQTTLLSANAQEGLRYWNATMGTYRAVPSAYSYGSDTGETAVGASMSWTAGSNGQPIGLMRTGPALLGGLWNASAPVGGPGTLTVIVQPSNAFVLVSHAGAPGSNFNNTEWEWAPTVASNEFTLPTGKYNVTVELADYAPQTFSDVAVSPINHAAVTAHLVSTPSLGIYTPLWAWSNAQVAALAASGAGTLSHPYVIINDQPSLLSGFWGVLNDLGYPVFPGVFFIGTSVYTEFASPPSLAVDVSGARGSSVPLPTTNHLPYWFYDDANIAILNASDITGWFAASAYDYPLFLTFNVVFWNSTNTLIANDTFNTQSQALLLYNGRSAQNPFAAGVATIWGNRFLQVPSPSPAAAVVPYADGLGLSEQESFDLIFNNYFATPTTAVSYPEDLYFGYDTPYPDTWNVTPQPATDITHLPNWPGVPLQGSIIGGAIQAGNYWWDYGLTASPYAFLGFFPNYNPYFLVPYTESGWLDYFGFGYGDLAPLLYSPLFTLNLTADNPPAGAAWSYTISSVSDPDAIYYSSTSTDPTVTLSLADLPSATYQLNVSAPDRAPLGERFTMSGNTSVTFRFVWGFAVTFSETGVAVGAEWNVTLNGSTDRSTTSTIFFSGVPNGTYAYTASAGPDYVLVMMTPGSPLLVNGSGVSVSLGFRPAYAVTFTERGMPASAGGGVDFNGTGVVPFGSDGALTFGGVVNGSYPYALSPGAGYQLVSSGPGSPVHVNGANVAVAVVFEAIYTVTFTEAGMPPTAGGGVNFNGEGLIAFPPDGTLAFGALVNGSYGYAVVAGAGYELISANPGSPVEVQGASESVSVEFAAVYTVTFTETGMPPAAGGGVNFSGQGLDPFGSTGTLAFTDVVNGTYTYTIVPGAGYELVSASPTSPVTVAGSDVQIAVVFAAGYAVTFTETGLPNGTLWALTLRGSAQSAIAPAPITFDGIVNGSWAFGVSAPVGYAASPASGSVVVAGGSVSLVIAFTPFAPGTYVVTFTEIGLTTGTSWSVTVGTQTLTSATANVTFGEPNGTYAFTVGMAGSFYPIVGGSGLFQVDGQPIAIGVLFVYTSEVTIQQAGIPNGTNWEVQVTLTSGSAAAGTAVVGTSWFANSTSTTALFQLPNGTYSFRITASGYQTTSGGFTANGASKTVPVTVVANASSSGTPWWIWAVIGIAVAAVLVLALALWARRRRPGTPGGANPGHRPIPMGPPPTGPGPTPP